MTHAESRPAFYARSTGTGGLRDWITVLHPPYTAWHLSYVAMGAALAPRFETWRLAGTLVAFFLAVGVGAHALDELAGRPLQTGIPSSVLGVAGALGVGVPVVVGVVYGGWKMVPFVAVGAGLAVAYNLELAGGRAHNGAVFAFGWGAFPLLTGYYAQGFTLGLEVVPAALAAFLLSWAQRALSTPARTLRRRTSEVTGQVVYRDGTSQAVDRAFLLAPLETALKCTAWGLVALSIGMVASRL